MRATTKHRFAIPIAAVLMLAIGASLTSSVWRPLNSDNLSAGPQFTSKLASRGFMGFLCVNGNDDSAANVGQWSPAPTIAIVWLGHTDSHSWRGPQWLLHKWESRPFFLPRRMAPRAADKDDAAPAAPKTHFSA